MPTIASTAGDGGNDTPVRAEIDYLEDFSAIQSDREPEAVVRRMAKLMGTSDIDDELLRRASEGDATAWPVIFGQVHARLRRMVAVRLDVRLAGRIDPSDVLQETYIDAVNQLAEYLETRPYPFFLWLRFLTGNRLNKLHRYHLGTQSRDATREMSLQQSCQPGVSSAALASFLIGRDARPDQIVRRAELRLRVHEAVNSMNEIDREILSLRHFEHLSTTEAAAVLEISEAAAGRRYLRALSRIKSILAEEQS